VECKEIVIKICCFTRSSIWINEHAFYFYDIYIYLDSWYFIASPGISIHSRVLLRSHLGRYFMVKGFLQIS